MLGTQMVPETLVAFNELTHLIAWEDLFNFILKLIWSGMFS
jgi:hypothetical protein